MNPNAPRMNENIFVKNSGGSWSIVSPYWEVPCVDERSAFRLKEIIECAYNAGADDVREDLYDLITPNRMCT